ncbi:MAG: leucyl aminopeptidase [Waddliaceae bacterium]
MDFLVVNRLQQRKRADILVIPYWKGKKGAESAAAADAFDAVTKPPIQMKDFLGNEGEVQLVYGPGQLEKRVALLGLGDEIGCTVETLRRSYSSLVKMSRQKNMAAINLIVPKVSSLKEEEILNGMIEGMLLSNYAFEQLKKESKKPTTLVKKATLIGVGKQSLSIAKKAGGVAEGVYLARDLVNANADDVTPQKLVELARDFAKQFPQVKATIFNKKRLAKENMNLILAVNRGSKQDPALIILEYKGRPKSSDHTVIVGKGVTYDTGGLNLKPTGAMETMKCDMSGAAAVFGTIFALAKTGVDINITGLIPTTENSIGPNSYKPGDVYSSYAGKTVEIGNTDAEGRLILADALAYANKQLKPSRMIDLATLTGAIVVALGENVTGLMSNDDRLANALIQSGEATCERVWRLPLFEEYRKQLKSDIADIKNTGGREAAAITAGMFLKDFVGKTPWAHLDIAGTAYLSKASGYCPKNATGVGVRLMIHYLTQLASHQP